MAKRANNRPTFRRYLLTLIVRPDPDQGAYSDLAGQAEQEVRHVATACCEHHARRKALEIAYANNLLVSRFVSVEAGKEV